MADNVIASIRFLMEATFQTDYGITGSLVSNSVSKNTLYSLATSGTYDVNIMGHKSATIAAAGSEDLDLKALPDPLGDACDFDTIVGLLIRNTSAVAAGSSIELQPSTSNGWLGWLQNASDILIIPPGGEIMALFPAGLALDGTHKNITLTDAEDGAGDITYDIIVIGKT